MSTALSNSVFRICALVLASLVSSAWANPAAIPVETFYKRPEFGNAVLSPSGKTVAVLVPAKDRRQLAMLDVESRKAERLTDYTDVDVLNVVWQSDERLIIFLGDALRGTGEASRISRTVAINRDGTQLRDLPRSFERGWSMNIVAIIPGSDEVLVTARERTTTQADLYRLDTKTGKKTLLSFTTPGSVQSWVVDLNFVPRAISTQNLDEDREAWYVRKDGDSPWKLVEEAKLNSDLSTPLAFSADGKQVFVRSRRGGDRQEIFEYDIESGNWGKAVIKHPERDITGNFQINRASKQVLGFRYVDDKPSVIWFDPEYARIQKGIDGALKDTVNILQRARDANLWLVNSYSDTNPGTLYLLDGKTFKLEKMFDYMSWIKPQEMSETRWVRYPARDGLSIPAMITVPKGAKGKVPLIVDIHGGPYVPATDWGFNTDVQFFASRGYAVLQPQFRGTNGFGFKHFSAGFRKWGDEMQDDLADGVKWAVAQGIADPDRVCFYGASYGGYAAKWGAIKNKDIIKCAVSFVGVSSIDYLFDNALTDVAQLVERSSQAVVQIGDPKTERARFKRVSPLNHADKVGVPILMAYGEEDRRVPLVHGTAFKAAMDSAGKPYEWVTYEGEGHGFAKSNNVFDFYNRVEKFLAKHLK